MKCRCVGGAGRVAWLRLSFRVRFTARRQAAEPQSNETKRSHHRQSPYNSQHYVVKGRKGSGGKTKTNPPPKKPFFSSGSVSDFVSRPLTAYPRVSAGPQSNETKRSHHRQEKGARAHMVANRGGRKPTDRINPHLRYPWRRA